MNKENETSGQQDCLNPKTLRSVLQKFTKVLSYLKAFFKDKGSTAKGNANTKVKTIGGKPGVPPGMSVNSSMSEENNSETSNPSPEDSEVESLF